MLKVMWSVLMLLMPCHGKSCYVKRDFHVDVHSADVKSFTSFRLFDCKLRGPWIHE